MPVTVTTRVDDQLAKLIDEIARTEGTDRSTVIRRFLSKSLQRWLIETSLEAYDDGKMTLWQAAKRCGLTLWEMIEEVKRSPAHVPYSLEDLKEDLKCLTSHGTP